MADPNTLYSTVVQSSATIVAIVGAIVTADVVNLSAKRVGLEQDISNRERELASQRDRADQLRLEWLYATRVHEIVEWTDLPSSWRTAQERLSMPSTGGASVAEISDGNFSKWWEHLRADIAGVDVDIDRIGVNGDQSFGDWIRENRISFPGRLEWLAQQRYNRKRSATEHDTAAPQSPPSQSRREPGLEEETLAEIAALDRLMTQIKAELDQLNVQRQETGVPPASLRWGLAVLGVIALAGLGPSLWFMPQDAEDYRYWHKAVVIAGFVFSLVLGFLYVAWLMRPVHLGGGRRLNPFHQHAGTASYPHAIHDQSSQERQGEGGAR